jgi:hypothetical protein
MSVAQKLWHVSKAHLLELFKEGFWRRAGVQSTTLAALRARHALAVRVRSMPMFEGKVAIVPGPEPRWLVEPEENRVMIVPAAEVTVLEMRHMTEAEHKIATAKLQHQPRVPEVPEVPRLEVPGKSEPCAGEGTQAARAGNREAERALEEAKRDHEAKVEEIRRERAALDRRAQAEDARWEKQKEKLETALRRARVVHGGDAQSD